MTNTASDIENLISGGDLPLALSRCDAELNRIIGIKVDILERMKRPRFSGNSCFSPQDSFGPSILCDQVISQGFEFLGGHSELRAEIRLMDHEISVLRNVPLPAAQISMNSNRLDGPCIIDVKIQREASQEIVEAYSVTDNSARGLK